MIIWMCALHCEAKPVIDFYRLKKVITKSTEKNSFDLYNNELMTCIVSGIGFDNMASAISWANNLFNNEAVKCWINIGVAGHKSLATGTCVLIDEASSDYDSPTSDHNHFFTNTNFKHSFEMKPIISLTRESIEYTDTALFDMEAFSFLKSTSKLAPLELCQVIKVISDNEITPPDRNKARISQLIAANMPSISEFVSHLQGKQVHNKQFQNIPLHHSIKSS